MATCPACRGERPKPGAAACGRCRGKLEVEESVPAAALAGRPYREFMATLAFFRSQGVLPEPGGLLDQPATWVDAALLVIGRLEEIERQDLERQRAELERARRRRR